LQLATTLRRLQFAKVRHIGQDCNSVSSVVGLLTKAAQHGHAGDGATAQRMIPAVRRKIMASQKLIDDFCIFRDHCRIVRRKYNTYNHLFFSGVDELLNKTAPVFFTEIAEIMLRDWLLQVCKIMDPPTKKVKGITYETLSIELLKTRLSEENLLTDQIKKLSSKILAYGDLIKPARNKIIAHFDRDSAVSGIVLGDHDEKLLSDFLANLQQYCDEVGRAIGVNPLDFSASRCKGDVLDLIRVLRKYFKDA